MKITDLIQKIQAGDDTPAYEEAVIYLWSLGERCRNDVRRVLSKKGSSSRDVDNIDSDIDYNQFQEECIDYTGYVDDVISVSLQKVLAAFKTMTKEEAGEKKVMGYLRKACYRTAKNLLHPKIGLKELEREITVKIVRLLSNKDKKRLIDELNRTLGFECTCLLWLKNFHTYKKMADIFHNELLPSSLRSMHYKCSQKLKKLKRENKKLRQLLEELNINW